jgi:3-oxoacyl-[acyl-carrier-protein] synthase-1
MYVSCLGLACPVGLTVESAAAAMRAGIDAFAELPYIDESGEPVVGATVPGIPSDARRRTRLVALLQSAFAGALDRLREITRPEDVPLLLCTAELKGREHEFAGIAQEAAQLSGARFRREGSRHIPGGAVAPFQALLDARSLIAQGVAPMYIVAAADTLVDGGTLEALQASRRLKCSAESDGIIPGEAAAVLIVSSRPLIDRTMMVVGLGVGRESATVLNDEPLLGKGLSAAVAAALAEAGLAMHDIDFRLSDVAGESYAFEELALAQARLMRQTRTGQPLWHPASSVGDCGAANGMLQLALAQEAFARRYAPGRTALAHSGEPTGARAAAVLSKWNVNDG